LVADGNLSIRHHSVGGGVRDQAHQGRHPSARTQLIPARRERGRRYLTDPASPSRTMWIWGSARTQCRSTNISANDWRPVHRMPAMANAMPARCPHADFEMRPAHPDGAQFSSACRLTSAGHATNDAAPRRRKPLAVQSSSRRGLRLLLSTKNHPAGQVRPNSARGVSRPRGRDDTTRGEMI